MKGEDLGRVLADVILDYALEFRVGERAFRLYPVTLAKQLRLSPHVKALCIDEGVLRRNPYMEALRVAAGHREACCHILAIHTAPNTRAAFHDTEAISLRRELFRDEVDPADLASLMLHVLSGDRTEALSRTVEGQEKLDQVTVQYQQRLENAKDAASAFGRTIYSVLESAASVADRLLGKLGGIGRVLGSLAGGSMLGSLGSLAGGIVGDWTWNRSVAEAAALQQRESELWQKRKSFKTEEAELERRISEARARAYDTTLSAAEQEAAVKEAVAATNALYDKRKQIAEETRDIAVGRLGLSDSDRDAEMAAEQAKADVINLEAQRQNALRFLNRMTTRLNNQDASDARAAAKAVKDAMEQRDTLFQQQMAQEEAHTRQHRAALNAQAEARIAAIGDAGERERAEARHQHELRLQQLQTETEAYRKANYEAAKKAYEAVHGAHTYSQTEEGGRGWQGVELTADQRATLVRTGPTIY